MGIVFFRMGAGRRQKERGGRREERTGDAFVSRLVMDGSSSIFLQLFFRSRQGVIADVFFCV